jgi:alpha-D-ribose 1-methylphosphonate 5-phosphate C-P lyase
LAPNGAGCQVPVVEPLTFDDVPFEVEYVPGARCAYCGSDDTFLVETSGGRYVRSDSGWCSRSARSETDAAARRRRAPLAWLPDPVRWVVPFYHSL